MSARDRNATLPRVGRSQCLRAARRKIKFKFTPSSAASLKPSASARCERASDFFDCASLKSSCVLFNAICAVVSSGPRNFARVKTLLQQFHDLLLRGKLFLQQIGAAFGDFEIQQAGADVAADFPDGGNKIPARGLGNFFRLGDAFAALAGGFNGQIKRHRHEPRAVIAGNLRIVAGRDRSRTDLAVRPPFSNPPARRAIARARLRGSDENKTRRA